MLISKYLKPNCLWDDDLQQGNIDETSRHTQKITNTKYNAIEKFIQIENEEEKKPIANYS